MVGWVAVKAEIITNSAQLGLGLGLSLAKLYLDHYHYESDSVIPITYSSSIVKLSHPGLKKKKANSKSAFLTPSWKKFVNLATKQDNLQISSVGLGLMGNGIAALALSDCPDG